MKFEGLLLVKHVKDSVKKVKKEKCKQWEVIVG